MLVREYVKPSIWQKYLQLKQMYPPSSNNCNNAIIETLKIKKAERRNQALEFGSQTASDWADAYERLINEHRAKWALADCDRRNEIKKIDQLNDIIEDKAKEYLQKVNEQTKKANKTVLFIGTSIMLIGLFIIIRR